jgi:hypothetical protein
MKLALLDCARGRSQGTVPAISRRTVERDAYVLRTIIIYIPRDRLNRRRRKLLHGDGASILPKVPG